MQMQGVHVAAPHDVGRSTNGSAEPLPIGEFYPSSALAAKIEFKASPDTALPALPLPGFRGYFRRHNNNTAAPAIQDGAPGRCHAGNKPPFPNSAPGGKPRPGTLRVTRGDSTDDTIQRRWPAPTF